jgi:hypothetical protein
MNVVNRACHSLKAPGRAALGAPSHLKPPIRAVFMPKAQLEVERRARLRHVDERAPGGLDLMREQSALHARDLRWGPNLSRETVLLRQLLDLNQKSIGK